MRRSEWPSVERMAAHFAAEGQKPNQIIASLKKFTDEKQQLKDSAKEWESFFVGMLLKEMQKTVKKDPMFHGGQGEEIFGDMLADETARNIARSTDGFGIASMLEDTFVTRLHGGLIQQDAVNLRRGVETPKFDLKTLGLRSDGSTLASPLTTSLTKNAGTFGIGQAALSVKNSSERGISELRTGMSRAFAASAYAQATGSK